MRSYVKVCILSLGVALTGAGLPACGSGTRTPPSHSATASGAVVLSGESLHYVQVEAAEAPPPTASRTLFARISFDEKKVAALGAPVSGRVTAVYVTTGVPVTRGQPLLMIHSADVAAANAQLAESRHARMLAEQTSARLRSLLQQGAASDAEYQQAQTGLKTALDEERRASQAVGALGVTSQGADYTLRSPLQGTVVERPVMVGNAVAGDQGTPLVTVADLSSVWVLVDVYEQDLPYVRQGYAARVEVPSLRDRVYEGAVAYVGSVLDVESRTARARIELPNTDGALRPGMFAEVEIRSPEVATAWVPTSAVLARRDEFYVFVEQTHKNQFKARRVELGSERGNHVAILSGLRPGEPVVTRGAILLDAEANTAF